MRRFSDSRATALLQRRDNPAMRVVRLRNIAVGLHQQLQIGPDAAPEIADHVQQDRRAGMLVDGEVKRLVQREIASGVAGLDRALHAGERRLYLDQPAFAHPRGGHLTRQPFDGNADMGQFLEGRGRQQGHDNRAVVLHLEQPLGDQPLQRLTDRRRRDAEGLGKLADDQRLARAETA